MKRHGNLWKQMISFEALLCASEQARRGKRCRPTVAAFEFNLERELCRLHEELTQKTYRPGAYRSFFIHEPKKRQISAAPYRDRVVHHALVSVLEPIFESTFIADSYACRKGKGTHAAVHRCQHFSRQYRYVLKADIRKFFPSVDHQILKALLARKIKDPDVMWLVEQIIDGSNSQEVIQHCFPDDNLFTSLERRRGIPIGNQTSQFFANVYLDPLDHFVKDWLGIKGFVRYVDDFLVFSDRAGAVTPARLIRFACGATCLLGCCSAGRRISNRVLRGGSFNNNASNVRSAIRNTNQFGNRNNNNNNGFRVGRTLPEFAESHRRSVPGCKVHRCPVSGCCSSHRRTAVRPNAKPIRRVW